MYFIFQDIVKHDPPCFFKRGKVGSCELCFYWDKKTDKLVSKSSADTEEVYLMPHTAVVKTSKDYSIIGTLRSKLTTTLWQLEKVDVNYIYPVPKSKSIEKTATC